jgi:hypothetical protein
VCIHVFNNLEFVVQLLGKSLSGTSSSAFIYSCQPNKIRNKNKNKNISNKNISKVCVSVCERERERERVEENNTGWLVNNWCASFFLIHADSIPVNQTINNETTVT